MTSTQINLEWQWDFYRRSTSHFLPISWNGFVQLKVKKVYGLRMLRTDISTQLSLPQIPPLDTITIKNHNSDMKITKKIAHFYFILESFWITCITHPSSPALSITQSFFRWRKLIHSIVSPLSPPTHAELTISSWWSVRKSVSQWAKSHRLSFVLVSCRRSVRLSTRIGTRERHEIGIKARGSAIPSS